MDVANAKAEFLVNVKPGAVIRARSQAVHESYVSAVATRNRNAPTFSKDSSAGDRSRFVQGFKDAIQAAASSVRADPSEERLIAAIEELSHEMSQEHAGALFRRRLRVGIAQKALNLYLKYMWCLDPAWPTPLHCPLDGVVLGEARVPGAWTQLDCAVTYRNWIRMVASCAMRCGFASMAEWELKVWQDRKKQDNPAKRCG